MNNFELVTWYDTWNQTGLNNLVNKTVPLFYATRYNLAFGSLVSIPTGGYSIQMGPLAAQVLSQIAQQAPSVKIYAGLGSTGILDAVADNISNNNRSTTNMVSWLLANGYRGISIDAEEFDVMASVPKFVTQLGPSFQAAGLGIAISVPWPGSGPVQLYGNDAVTVFNQYVEALEFQNYSSSGTPSDDSLWISAGINVNILMGGICTENSDVQTSFSNITTWTQYAVGKGYKGMFSWRLDNDHGKNGQEEDVNPTFTGAIALAQAAMPFVPNGSYKYTSTGITSTLQCLAQKIDQSWVPASFDLTNVAVADLANMNGVLVQGNSSPSPNGYLPGGSYLLTSQDCKVILSANCQKADGTWQQSQLDITHLPVSQTISNINGVLTPDN